jgi:hypothetical protein
MDFWIPIILSQNPAQQGTNIEIPPLNKKNEGRNLCMKPRLREDCDREMTASKTSN